MSRVSTTDPKANAIATMDPVALMRIKNLQMRAKTVVEGYYSGLHRSPFHGNSVEFREYRSYSHGDDLRNLDWKLFARSDRYYIKKFDDETNRQCTLLFDQSRSMEFGSLQYTKADYAQTLLATFAYYLTSQRDSVGLLTFDESIRDYHPPTRTNGQLRRIMASLARSPRGKDTDMVRPLEEVSSLAKRRGLIVLVSDFLTPIESLASGFSFLRARGHQVFVIRVLDPSEMTFGIQSPSMVVDMESGEEVFIDPVNAKAAYQESFESHRTDLQTMCSDLGIDLFEVTTEQPIDSALHELISQQTRDRKKHKHRTTRRKLSESSNLDGVANIGGNE